MKGLVPEKVGCVIGYVLFYLPMVNYTIGIVLSAFEFVFIRNASFSMRPSDYPFFHYWISISVLAASHIVIRQVSGYFMTTFKGVLLFLIFFLSAIATSVLSVICSHNVIQKIF